MNVPVGASDLDSLDASISNPAQFAPAPELRVADVDTLRVLADPLRLRILEAFEVHPDDPLTVKAVAAALGEPITKLYYHVNLLERHGLLAVVGKRLVSGIVEKRYRLAAESLHVDRSLLGSPAAGVSAEAATLLDAVFGDSRRNLERALGSGLARLGADEPEPARVLLARFVQRLSPEAAVEARRLVEELIERIGALAAGPAAPAASAGAGDAHQYEFLVVFHPLAGERDGPPATPASSTPTPGTGAAATQAGESPSPDSVR